MTAVGQYSFAEYLELISRFHSYPAPGLIVGGYMVELAKRHIPQGVLYDAISEAASCLPDAIQLLTPCTAGNGWLKVINLDRYALALFDKRSGAGVRVFLDPAKLGPWPHTADWYLKRKTKKEQDSEALREEMRAAGEAALTVMPVQVAPAFIGKSSKGAIGICPLCAEAYPLAHGPLCKGCQGDAPYVGDAQPAAAPMARPVAVPVAQAVGQTALHDMTRIVPGRSKGPAFKAGQPISAHDVCRLQEMGRMHVYVAEQADVGADWVHEDEAAMAMARALAAEGSLTPCGLPREGKVSLTAAHAGLLLVDAPALQRLNLLPGVVLATLHAHTLVAAGDTVAAARAVPLYLPRKTLAAAQAMLAAAPLARVAPLRRARAGLLITGTEVFQGLVQDRFAETLTPKLEALGSTVIGTVVAPDDRSAIAEGLRTLLEAGADLVVTTAGLSVDPDDVTRQALVDAGARDLLYGLPVLPGSMSLVGRIDGPSGPAQLLGVPACALFHAATGLDLLLPRLLAGVEITRRGLAAMGHGGLCRDCPACAYPHCPFGK